MTSRLASIALVLFLAACSGGGQSPSAVVAPQATPVALRALAPTSFVFAKPKVGLASTRAPKYVTSSITNVTIALTSVNSAPPASGLTTSVSTPISLASCPCSVPGPAVPPGSDAFTLTTYDGSNAIVSQASATFAIAAGAANSNSVTLNGVPAAFSFGTLPAGTAGTAFTATAIAVNVLDADRNTIVGTYASPVTLTDSDTSDLGIGTALAINGGTPANSVQLTSSSDVVTLHYGGLAIPAATLSATAAGATTGTTQFTPSLSPMVYTAGTGANASGQEIDLYAASGTGSSGSFSVSELGYSSTGYSVGFFATVPSSCAQIATVSPSFGTTFTARVVASPVAGSCTITIGDGGLHTPLNVTLTYTSSGIGVI